jgi:hypothetical protein
MIETVKELLIFFGLIIIISMVSNYIVMEEHFYPQKIIDGVKFFINRAIYWNDISKQDSNYIIALIHSSYAYILSTYSRNLVNDDYIKNNFEVNITELIYDIQETQKNIMNKIYKKYPTLKN